MRATDTETDLTWERLDDLLAIYPESGHFVWKVWRGGTAKAGTLAGTTGTSGYLMIKVDGHFYLAHRLMWLYVHRRWPVGNLDHRNGDLLDARIENLREATRSQNTANSIVRKDSMSGLRGVRQFENRFGARITKDGVREFLGLFDTAGEAHAAYAAAAHRLFGEYART